MSAKLFLALGAYALLAIVAATVLIDPRLKAAVIVLMAALAAKTWIGELKRRSELKSQPANPRD